VSEELAKLRQRALWWAFLADEDAHLLCCSGSMQPETQPPADRSLPSLDVGNPTDLARMASRASANTGRRVETHRKALRR
jgi:hypothetical protein